MNEKDLIENFAKKQEGGFFPCPRCGRMAMSEKVTRNALSRRAAVYICDACGTEEALEDMAGEQQPLSRWDISLDPARFRMDNSSRRLALHHIGRDSWDRPVYESDGKLYVDVDPRSLHRPEIYTKYRNEFDGEPDVPLCENTAVDFLPMRDCWDIS